MPRKEAHNHLDLGIRVKSLEEEVRKLRNRTYGEQEATGGDATLDWFFAWGVADHHWGASGMTTYKVAYSVADAYGPLAAYYEADGDFVPPAGTYLLWASLDIDAKVVPAEASLSFGEPNFITTQDTVDTYESPAGSGNFVAYSIGLQAVGADVLDGSTPIAVQLFCSELHDLWAQSGQCGAVRLGDIPEGW